MPDSSRHVDGVEPQQLEMIEEMDAKPSDLDKYTRGEPQFERRIQRRQDAEDKRDVIRKRDDKAERKKKPGTRQVKDEIFQLATKVMLDTSHQRRIAASLFG